MIYNIFHFMNKMQKIMKVVYAGALKRPDVGHALRE
jgi:hypothetical protein